MVEELPLEEPEEGNGRPRIRSAPMTVEEILPFEEPDNPTDERIMRYCLPLQRLLRQRKSRQRRQKHLLPRKTDYIAWMSIPGTVIDYPVVRSDRTDYYLHHLITGQESKLGSLFSLTTSDYRNAQPEYRDLRASPEQQYSDVLHPDGVQEGRLLEFHISRSRWIQSTAKRPIGSLPS